MQLVRGLGFSHTQVNNGMLYRDAVASLCSIPEGDMDKEAAQNLLASVYYAISGWLGELTTPDYPCFSSSAKPMIRCSYIIDFHSEATPAPYV